MILSNLPRPESMVWIACAVRPCSQWKRSARKVAVARPNSRTQFRNIMSSTEGFSILKNWKTFRSALWQIKSPRAFGGDWPVFVTEISERKRLMVLEFAGVSESVNLKGARFESAPR